MNELEVKLVTLPPMRMVSAYGFGDSPEEVAWDKLKTFAIRQGMLNDGAKPVTYGFNNPDPSHGSPNYGYELWLPVSKDIQPEGDLRIIEFPGGLFAMTRFKGLDMIGKMWGELVRWVENSPYRMAPGSCLEELVTWPDGPIEEYIFNLYLPVTE